MRRRLRSTVAALVMLPMLLLAGVAQASVLYRCRMDGQTRKTCCCDEAKQQLPPSGPTIRRSSCCDTEVRTHVASAPATQNGETRAAAVAATLPVEAPFVVVTPPLARYIRVARRDLEPPPPRIAIVLLKSSFLI